MSKHILIVCRKAPYGNSLSREAIDIALAASVFEQKLALLFLSDGVWQLKKDQNSEAIAMKNHGKVLSALPLYDINAIYADKHALEDRNLTTSDLLLGTELLAESDIPSFINNFDVVLSF